MNNNFVKSYVWNWTLLLITNLSYLELPDTLLWTVTESFELLQSFVPGYQFFHNDQRYWWWMCKVGFFCESQKHSSKSTGSSDPSNSLAPHFLHLFATFSVAFVCFFVCWWWIFKDWSKKAFQQIQRIKWPQLLFSTEYLSLKSSVMFPLSIAAI